MNLASRIWIGLTALRELGPKPLSLYALYRLGLQTGHYHRQLSSSLTQLDKLNIPGSLQLHACLALPDRRKLTNLLGDQINQLYSHADEIVNGKVRLFGGQSVPLVLTLLKPFEYWTKYETGTNHLGDQDIKFIWEPARFGWACTLAMAYHLSRNERYLQAFWKYSQEFVTSNPPYMGPQWCSAQEVAIRLVALAFALQVFAQPGLASADQLDLIAWSITIHAERIPPTLVYARSQNNNHLISEALGLYTASAILPDHPLAAKWHRLGWQWLQYAFRTQIDADGTYIQHSTNYHRLMLQAALWAYAVNQHSFDQEKLPPDILSRLQAATHWLSLLPEPETGRVPNLGHNDGAYILPLTICPYEDYRSVIHAASMAFTQTALVPGGVWQDMGYWLSVPPEPAREVKNLDSRHARLSEHALPPGSPHLIINQANGSRGLLQVAQYHSRPAHADQLHLDLWWHGMNLALDPGTYLYNSAAPWENALVSAFVHNTVTIDGHESMRRAGRFLYLDWAQAKVLSSHYSPENKSHTLMASHNGYRKLGITHTRTVITFSDGHWEILDRLDGRPAQPHSIRLHWLVPDWVYEYQLATDITSFPWVEMRIRSPYGWVTLRVGKIISSGKIEPLPAVSVKLARAGRLLHGTGSISPTTGWTSPTYGDKIAALALIIKVSQPLPIELKSEWKFPSES